VKEGEREQPSAGLSRDRHGGPGIPHPGWDQEAALVAAGCQLVAARKAPPSEETPRVLGLPSSCAVGVAAIPAPTGGVARLRRRQSLRPSKRLSPPRRSHNARQNGGSDDGDDSDGMDIDSLCDAREVEDGIDPHGVRQAKLHDVGLLPYAVQIGRSAPRVAAGAVAASSARMRCGCECPTRIRADSRAFGVCAS
jgi:hypothetical protein